MKKISRLVRALLVAAGIAGAGLAQANLVNNGDFETRDFSGWTQFGDTSFSGVWCPGVGTPWVVDGACSADFGSVGLPGGIAQTLATTAGTTYSVNFAVMYGNGTPSYFDFSWNGTPGIVNLVDPAPSAGFINYHFLLAATSAATDIRFTFRNDPDFNFFDGVSVTAVAVPEPASWLLAGLGLAAAATVRRRRVGA